MDKFTKEEVFQLLTRIREGDIEARNIYVELNMGLVKSYVNKKNVGADEFGDLCEEGYLALIHAVENYDMDCGVAFSTYAFYWISDAVNKAMIQRKMVSRVGVKVVKMARKFEKLSGGDSEPNVDAVQGVLKCTRKSAEKVIACIVARKSESIDENIHGFKEKRQNEVDLLGKLSILNERERMVVEMNFGVNGYREMNLSEIGKYFGLSREAIRKTKDAAIKKLQKRFSDV